jgi:hypothetical protein
MRHPILRLVLASATACLVFAGSASAATFTDKASLTRHGRVVFGQPISANVNLHTRFASISSVCFFFTLEDDPLDPGEELDVTFHANVGGFGQSNIFATPLASFGICLVPDHSAMIARFLDGKEKLILSMFSSGSVRVDRLEIVIDGVRG